MQNALYQSVNSGGRRNEAKSILQTSSTELFSNRRQQLERTFRRRSTLGVENFPRRKVDFAKDIVKSFTSRVRQAKMSNATMSKHSDDENDDFFTLDKFIFSSYVESDVLKHFSRQLRT